MTYSDRMTSGDQQNQGTVPSTFAANSNTQSNNKSRRAPKQNCTNFVTKGKCSYGDRCRFLHDEKIQKLFLANKETGGGDDKKEKNNGGNRNNSRPGNDKHDSNNHASCVATRNDETPIVPLPTQNFRQ